MLVVRLLILISTSFLYTHVLLKPGDVEPDWLTLATNPQTTQGQTKEFSDGRQNTVQDNQHISTSNTEKEAMNPESSYQKIKSSNYYKSPETRAKLRATWTAERREKQREKMTLRNTGSKHSIETIKKMKKSQKGKQVSQSTRQKISDGMKKALAIKKANKEKASEQYQV